MMNSWNKQIHATAQYKTITRWSAPTFLYTYFSHSLHNVGGGILTSLENQMELKKGGSHPGLKMQTLVTISCLGSIWVNPCSSLDFSAWILF